MKSRTAHWRNAPASSGIQHLSPLVGVRAAILPGYPVGCGGPGVDGQEHARKMTCRACKRRGRSARGQEAFPGRASSGRAVRSARNTTNNWAIISCRAGSGLPKISHAEIAAIYLHNHSSCTCNVELLPTYIGLSGTTFVMELGFVDDCAPELLTAPHFPSKVGGKPVIVDGNIFFKAKGLACVGECAE